MKILQSDTSFLTSKHSGKFISNFTNDTLTLSNVLNGIAVNAVKEGVTLIFLLVLMFYQNWKLSLQSLLFQLQHCSQENWKKNGKSSNYFFNH